MYHQCYVAYLQAIEMMGPTPLKAVKEELIEFIKEPTKEEASDVLHSVCRVLRVPNRLTYHIAHTTAIKHAGRMLEYNCPRSQRNCISQGADCCCGGNSLHQRTRQVPRT